MSQADAKLTLTEEDWNEFVKTKLDFLDMSLEEKEKYFNEFLWALVFD